MQTWSFKGGVHPMHSSKEGKLPTRNSPIRDFVSDIAVIPMAMHLGAPSNPCVTVGDKVKIGQLIGEPVGGLGLPVHASVSGEVTAVAPILQLGDSPVMCVTIKNDFADEWSENLAGLGNVETADPSQIIPKIKECGICGMGGATFPTHIKLTIQDKTCDTIILNGAECETYLTSDFRLMIESPERIVDGLRAAMRALDVKRGVIAIEDNKPEAIESMKKAAAGRAGVEVVSLKTKYPQGSEKQLIYAVTGREVPSKKLPIDVGTIVLNVATAYAIADAVIDGKPLVSRVTTVTGKVNDPANLRVRIGTVIDDIIGICGGYAEDPGKIIMGGGMTGLCAPDEHTAITKGSGGIVVLSIKEAKALTESQCIRCGKCVEACPIGLEPYLLKKLIDKNRTNEAEAFGVMECIVCGACSYACPARIWLTASFKNTKDKITLAARRAKI